MAGNNAGPEFMDVSRNQYNHDAAVGNGVYNRLNSDVRNVPLMYFNRCLLHIADFEHTKECSATRRGTESQQHCRGQLNTELYITMETLMSDVFYCWKKYQS